MTEETLTTAARRAVRFFFIDMQRGGLVTPETEAAMQTLDRMVRKVIKEEEKRESATAQ